LIVHEAGAVLNIFYITWNLGERAIWNKVERI